MTIVVSCLVCAKAREVRLAKGKAGAAPTKTDYVSDRVLSFAASEAGTTVVLRNGIYVFYYGNRTPSRETHLFLFLSFLPFSN